MPESPRLHAPPELPLWALNSSHHLRLARRNNVGGTSSEPAPALSGCRGLCPALSGCRGFRPALSCCLGQRPAPNAALCGPLESNRHSDETIQEVGRFDGRQRRPTAPHHDRRRNAKRSGQVHQDERCRNAHRPESGLRTRRCSWISPDILMLSRMASRPPPRPAIPTTGSFGRA